MKTKIAVCGSCKFREYIFSLCEVLSEGYVVFAPTLFGSDFGKTESANNVEVIAKGLTYDHFRKI